jgi:Lar family restriction alleviation protein
MTPEYKEPVALDPNGLLPCPFCGGAPRGAIYSSGRFAVHCDCHADGPSKWTGGELSGENFERAKADAIAAWNRRAYPSVREIGEPVVKALTLADLQRAHIERQAAASTAPECEGRDDPGERCPRPPHECTCWQVDEDHPTMKQATPPVAVPAVGEDRIDKAVVEALNALRMEHSGRAYDILHDAVLATAGYRILGPDELERKFKLGDRVTKIKGSSWTGHVVGFYSTALTPIGYAVESENEPGSVQIYPESALAQPDSAKEAK